LTDTEAAEFAEEMRRGQTYLYRPGRVTVKMLCAHFRIPRRKFYRWLDNLDREEFKLLQAAMSGRSFKIKKGAVARDYFPKTTPAGEPYEDFPYDKVKLI